MNIKKPNKIVLSIAIVMLGMLLSGFAFTTTYGPWLSTICGLLALALVFGGFVLFIIGLTSK